MAESLSDAEKYQELLTTMRVIASGSTPKLPGMSVQSRPLSKSEMQMLAIASLDRCNKP